MSDSPGNRDLYEADKDFTQSVKDRMTEKILVGHTPEGAAVDCGISTRKFNKWMRDFEMFASFIEGLVAQRNSTQREKIMEHIGNIDDHKEAAKLRIQMLERQDKEFGAKHDRLELAQEKEIVAPADIEDIEALKAKHRRDRQEVLDQAEDIANNE